MEAFQSFLAKIGDWTSKNKYLTAIKNSFETFMPFIIIGAIAVLWSNVIVNDATGLGAIFPPVMKLSFLNPAFDAINFCTMGIMALAIAFLTGHEMSKHYNLNSSFCSFLAVAALVTVTNTSSLVKAAAGETVTITGLFANELGTNGLFTGMLVAIISVELFRLLYRINALKIKLPDSVPDGIAKSFEYLIPGMIVLIITALLSQGVHTATGVYLNDVIFSMIQKPLMVAGSSLPGVMIFVLVSTLFWSVGLHGDNMAAGVVQPLFFALLAENTAAVTSGSAPTNIVNFAFFRCFLATGGTGVMLGLTLAILITGKREENRAIAKLALFPNFFNIGEINMFGVPVVLNPYLIIPFILSPLVCTLFGYFMTLIGICPVMYINVPWTMPPFFFGFLATGGKLMGGLVQLAAIAISTLIYLPFVRMYEKSQAQAAKN